MTKEEGLRAELPIGTGARSCPRSGNPHLSPESQCLSFFKIFDFLIEV